MKILPWSHLPTPRDVERLGKTLRAMREKAGLTQSDVAEMSGLTRRCVGLMERGRHRPTLATIRKVVKGFRCKITDLLGPAKNHRGEKEKGPCRAPVGKRL